MLSKLMKSAAVGALLFATPSANAAVTVVSGPTPGSTTATFTPTFGVGINNTVLLKFNGFNSSAGVPISGLTAELALTLLSVTGNSYNFSYILKNTSTNAAPGVIDASRISVFGFNSDPNLQSASVDNTDQFNLVKLNGAFNNNGGPDNAAGGLLEFCLKDAGNLQNCNSGAQGLAQGGTTDGLFSLTYSSLQSSIKLDNFAVRYQGIESSALGIRDGSAAGIVSGIVPEPATWAMMILGFGLIGGALRSRKAQGARVTYA